MNQSPWPVRRGGLELREAREPDLARLLSFRNDPGVNDFMVHTHVTPDEVRRTLLAGPDGTSGSDHSCVVERDGVVVAIGYLELVDGSGQPGVPERTEALIGYVVHPEAAGQRVGTTTAGALLDAAFEVLGVRRVRAAAFAENAASVAILERLGMRRERHSVRSLWHERLGWRDEVEYALLAEEWAARRGR